MKCQNCEKPATFHITELTGPEPSELHLCEDHARVYLKKSEEIEEPAAAPGWASFLSTKLQVGQTAEDLARLDQQACPMCGITFYEFRHAGRLGCPNDYTCFEEELNPLLVNIHGETEHVGKQPKRGVPDAEKQAELIRLRREMKEAVEREDYERASELRDEIQKIEEKQD